MGTAKATKAADKSQVCRKLVLAMQKLYGKSVPKIDLPVVETILFAACLEDNTWAPAEAGLKKLLESCFDLNEIRVSSVRELEKTLAPLRGADWKGLRIRSILRHVFETTYSYDFEKLRRQTLEQALKTLKKFHDLTPFMRDFVLHEILGSHIIVLDTSMLNAARWLGLVPVADNQQDASEFLKGGVKKSEASEFCHLLRCLATDQKFIPRFTEPPVDGLSMNDVMDRFVELQSPSKRKPAKALPPEPVKADKPSAAKKPVLGTAPVPPTKTHAVLSKPGDSSGKAASVAAKSAVPVKPPEAGKSHPPKGPVPLKPSIVTPAVKPVLKSNSRTLPSSAITPPVADSKTSKTKSLPPTNSESKKPAPQAAKAAAKQKKKK